jgi:cyclin-dependent kinase 10
MLNEPVARWGGLFARLVYHSSVFFNLQSDIKLSNLLLTNQGILKLADFGLARQFGDPIVQMTPGVVTLWYRPPEILFGMEKYTVAVDMWAIGCVFGELLKSQILLPGDTTTKQLILISELLGTPNLRIWPEMQDLPLYDTFNLPFYEFDTLSHKFSDFGSNTCDLIKSFLIYRPQNRISASQALKHEFFREHPKACPPNRLPTLEKFENSRYRRD